MTVIKIGSHLITQRSFYTHHGIYVGSSQVIHYSGLSDGLFDGPVVLTSLELFQSGQALTLRKYKNPKYIGQEVVERARSRISENKYDLQGNNCEHFCSWAITGLSNSQQVDVTEDIFDIITPGVVLTSAIKIRKHSKQGFKGKEVTKDIAEIGVKAAIVVTAPIALPVIIAFKTLKWLFK